VELAKLIKKLCGELFLYIKMQGNLGDYDSNSLFRKKVIQIVYRGKRHTDLV
jgi:hypothetical protein